MGRDVYMSYWVPLVSRDGGSRRQNSKWSSKVEHIILIQDNNAISYSEALSKNIIAIVIGSYN